MNLIHWDCPYCGYCNEEEQDEENFTCADCEESISRVEIGVTISTDEEATLAEILNTINDDTLRGWDKGFITGIREEYEDNGSEIFISGKMWVQLRRIGDAQ